jgi:hypothetical protein
VEHNISGFSCSIKSFFPAKKMKVFFSQPVSVKAKKE